RTEAEKLRGLDLLVPEKNLPPLEEGEAYLHELPGLAVFVLAEDGSESELGTILSVSAPAGQELWTITPTAAAASGRANVEILFPAVPEFVHAFDLPRRRVVICPPPGLLDLYL
ncbi:ribosome maturation factor RimM, partial [Desulfovibrio sp. OttesenSCG-928-I05]|nr:ribosome maturation factor RimM [Desulfovibrio sp. OttesenSCG-928-I05]